MGCPEDAFFNGPISIASSVLRTLTKNNFHRVTKKLTFIQFYLFQTRKNKYSSKVLYFENDLIKVHLSTTKS